MPRTKKTVQHAVLLEAGEEKRITCEKLYYRTHDTKVSEDPTPWIRAKYTII